MRDAPSMIMASARARDACFASPQCLESAWKLVRCVCRPGYRRCRTHRHPPALVSRSPQSMKVVRTVTPTYWDGESIWSALGIRSFWLHLSRVCSVRHVRNRSAWVKCRKAVRFRKGSGTFASRMTTKRSETCVRKYQTLDHGARAGRAQQFARRLATLCRHEVNIRDIPVQACWGEVSCPTKMVSGWPLNKSRKMSGGHLWW